MNFTGKTILIHTVGSLGDLHPYMAIALELKRRGHKPVIATFASFRNKIESEGIGFEPVRPDIKDLGDESKIIARVMNGRDGLTYVFQHLVIGPIRDTYADMERIIPKADLVVTHPLSIASHLILEKTGKPWVSTVLQPASLFSRYDPAILPGVPFMHTMRRYAGPGFYEQFYKVIRAYMIPTMRPITKLRRDIGLPATDKDPFFHGQFSPQCNLVMFSPVLGRPQPDWPVNSHQIGFCFYDKLSGSSVLPPEIEAFLKDGAPPIVFTLGSTAVMNAGDFYQESILAAQILGRRAILLTGRDERYLKLPGLNNKIIACPYAPYSELLPHASVIVHQGGVGTTGQVLRSGHPSLVVPWGQDQDDNAYRLCNLGVARTISKKAYRARLAAKELDHLLTDTSYATKARETAGIINAENGPSNACDAIEAML